MYKTFGDISVDPSGYYVAVIATLLLCILIALIFANFLKSDVPELVDEGLGDEEVRVEDDNNTDEWKRDDLINDIDDEEDDDEAYEEDLDPLSESDAEHALEEALNYNNLVGKIKVKRYQQNLEKNLSPSQIEEEQRIEREQLAAIFELLRKQEDELNLNERISDSELQQQLRLYR